MLRRSVAIAGAVAVTGAAFVAGASVPATEDKPPAEAQAGDKRPPLVIGQKTGFFNVARVMREYGRAKDSVARLGAKRDKLAAELAALRADHARLRTAAQAAADADKKFDLEQQVRTAARRIEDAEREDTKVLNDRASLIIGELYDEMYEAAAALSRDRGLSILFAYPDGATLAERESLPVKELKLKPPAAQPFYLDPSADYTDELIRRLNARPGAANDD
jgi:Skp family chaperone for outer membrane proteins